MNVPHKLLVAIAAGFVAVVVAGCAADDPVVMVTPFVPKQPVVSGVGINVPLDQVPAQRLYEESVEGRSQIANISGMKSNP